jgi:hypothetical protein
LQVVDFRDPAAPSIVGQLQVAGEPVEMYVAGSNAVVLLNGWRGYYGARGDVRPEAWEGGLVLVVDVRDPAHPVERARARVPGFIRTSRMVTGGGRDALYVAAQSWDTDEQGTWRSRTMARSFALADDGGLTPAGELDLGGDVADVQATPEVLLVARNDWQAGDVRSRIALVDIADPEGAMTLAGEVQATGQVRDKFDMDLYRGVLRVVSAGRGRDGNTNHVETFDVTNLAHPAPIDHKTFGDGQELFATVFLGNKAFFVTYFRRDPFHAFEIDDAGRITERAQFVVSGWNDVFRPAFGGDRLIGVGVNDEQGRTMAVSLYDTTDLSNPKPLAGRADVGFDQSWSEAQWDDKAFSVIEDAVSVPGPGGVTETGLVLLPFTGYDSTTQRHLSGVQIFTFSRDTITRRGVMDHGTPVRRSFLAGDALPANLSNEQLAFYDARDVDAPAKLGGVDLAPNHTDFFVAGEYGVRLRDTRDAYAWWGAGTEALPPSRLEVVRLADDPDRGAPVATVEIPAGAAVYPAGRYLVVVDSKPVQPTAADGTWQTESTLTAWDFGDPTHPRAADPLVTRDLPPAWGGWWGGPVAADAACFDCLGWSGWHETYAAGGVLTFVERVPQQRVIGHEQVCVERPKAGPETCEYRTEDGPQACSFYGGGVECRITDGQPEVCSGALQRCTLGTGGDVTCEAADPATVETERSCWDWDRYRYWQSFRLHVLDLTGAAPRLDAPLDVGADREAAGAFVAGDRLYLTFREPAEVTGDARPYVAWYFARVDATHPDAVTIEAPVNVPGELIAADDDRLYTRDAEWDGPVVRTAVDRLQLRDGAAVLQAARRFDGEEVEGVRLDGAGHLLVSHRPSWTTTPVDAGGGATTGGVAAGDVAAEPGLEDRFQALTILDAAAPDLAIRATVPVDTWAELRDAVAGRALFTVPGGLLVMNLDDAAHPWAQAYFATRGWPRRLPLAGRDLYFAGGRYGVYRFGLDDANLLHP